jgi:hypothetical protein
MTDTPAHNQPITNHYVMHFPVHEPRENDPNYPAFNAYHKAHEATAVCDMGQRLGLDQCADAQGKSMLDQPGHPGLELHHKHIEFATINEVDVTVFAADFPGVDDPAKIAAWAETADNFLWLCPRHHRGVGGVHHAAASDWEAERYIRDLIGPFSK